MLNTGRTRTTKPLTVHKLIRGGHCPEFKTSRTQCTASTTASGHRVSTKCIAWQRCLVSRPAIFFPTALSEAPQSPTPAGQRFQSAAPLLAELTGAVLFFALVADPLAKPVP